jgi:hypothetical protein
MQNYQFEFLLRFAVRMLFATIAHSCWHSSRTGSVRSEVSIPVLEINLSQNRDSFSSLSTILIL